MSEHLLEMAKALVRVKDGKIEVLTEPQVRCCPLRRNLYGIQEESRETVQRVLEGHMQELGMYGPERVLELQKMPVSFGASEILADAMKEGLIDAAVLVCEGAGTVVATRPDVLQAIGAHMTGLVKTEPIKEIQNGLEKRGCISARPAGRPWIRFEDLRWQYRRDYKKIAVTIAGSRADDADGAAEERDSELGIRSIILAVHTTGISESEARALAESCDLVWSCASRAVREEVGKRAQMQIGISIPVFALTQEGKRLILNRALHFSGPLVLHRAGLPLAPEAKQPEPLI